MVGWEQFVEQAPNVAEVFVRRHAATGNLCMLATLRSDGYPRISPMEPRIFEGHLVLTGCRTRRSSATSPRSTVLPAHGDGRHQRHRGRRQAVGHGRNLQDRGLHARFADQVYEEIGLDLRGQEFDPFYVGQLTGASALAFTDGHLVVTIWKPGQGERVVRKD